MTGGIREQEIKSWKTIPSLEETKSLKLPDSFGLPKAFRRRGSFGFLKIHE